MIVRNEAAIIDRCLAAAAPAIAAYVICDTGSSDDTPGRIRAFMDARGIPGEIHRFPFETFAQARNEALDRCRASTLPFSHVLLADADMELVVDDPGFAARLGEGGYSLMQRNGLVYWNVRIVARASPARYVGATHEYLAVEPRTERLGGAWFRDHADGASRPEKFARDERLLRAELERNPGDVRSLFYLARTLHDAGRFEDARAAYAQRVAAGGWDEERWYSLYAIARCFLAERDFRRALDAARVAQAMRPWRPESLHVAARALRELGRHDEAIEACEKGRAMPFPAGDSLFVDDDVLRHGFAEELSISGFYSADARRQQQGDEACGRLATSRDAPAAIRDRARRNEMHYAVSAAQAFGAVRYSMLAAPHEAPWHPFNPSLARHRGALWATLRLSNYRVEQGRYLMEGDAVLTRTLLGALGEGDALVDPREIAAVDEASMPPLFPSDVRGFEDCRLFEYQGSLFASATARDRNAANRCEIALLALDDQARILRADLLRGFHGELHQKNWLPFVDAGEIRFVYATDPLTILRYDPATRDVSCVSEAPQPLALGHLRGSAAPIAFDDGWLYMTHETVEVAGRGRCYLHRFVAMRRDYTLAALTRPFHFTRKGIEFAAGLAAEGDELVVAFGSADRQAFLMRVPAAGVRAALEPVERSAA